MSTLWHTPRCSKSRQALALLEEHGAAVVIRRYLDEAPSEAELRAVAEALGVGPRDMIRRGEAAYRELGLKEASDDALFAAMAAHPKLIERPVFLKDGRAALGRPPERVLDIL
ncbi:arsenate reductase (glutaredoxin) [Roseovarius sp.]|uniref:arsenate reductase (glutaredoxin) n=1 Tax=Roseovarius sp. TaxID=1486281 RepID=UPI000C476406|nr:arsenate reductase (glutaredoxin) [Roseovarius sp.]MAZ22404.1 arsenate reductase (glutaredoxin) [Roseovarius sp.]